MRPGLIQPVCATALALALLSLAHLPAWAAVRTTFLPDLHINSAGTVCGTVFDDENGLFVSSRGFIREADGTLTTYQFPGRTTIYWTDINSKGTIVGFRSGVDYHSVGFIRARNGSITEFQVPGSSYNGTLANSINDAGEVAGSYYVDPLVQHGFVRAVDGTITTFDAIGDGRDTHVTGINSGGEVTGGAGNTLTNDIVGFVRNARGEITTFAVPGASATWGLEILSSGVVGGEQAGKGFIRERDGTIETFDVTFTAMNARRMVTGKMLDANSVWHGFVRFADGSLEFFDASGAGTGLYQGTLASGINDRGDITGIFTDENYDNHGFVRSSQGTFTTFDVPLATESQVRKPNSQPVPAEVRAPDDGHAVVLRTRPFARVGERSTLEFELPEAAEVTIAVHDLAGRRVATLEHGPRSGGAHTVAWDTSGVPQGVYFYRLQAGRLTASRSVRLIQ